MQEQILFCKIFSCNSSDDIFFLRNPLKGLILITRYFKRQIVSFVNVIFATLLYLRHLKIKFRWYKSFVLLFTFDLMQPPRRCWFQELLFKADHFIVPIRNEIVAMSSPHCIFKTQSFSLDFGKNDDISCKKMWCYPILALQRLWVKMKVISLKSAAE